MKFSIAYYFLLLYITVIIKPLIPVVVNAWDHTFAEARHIATVHAKYGAHHLEKQLAPEEKDADGKTQNTVKNSEPVQVHCKSLLTYSIVVGAIPLKQFHPYIHQKLPLTSYAVTVPPPEV